MLLVNGTTELADLDTITEKIQREINGKFILTYSCVYQELKTQYLKTSQSITDNQTFDNVYVAQTNRNDVMFKVEAWHVFYRLKKITVDEYYYSGTVKEILEDIVSGTDFTIGTVDLTTSHTLTVNEEITKAQLIINFLNSLNLEIDFSDLGFTINALDSIGDNNGYTIEYGKNSQGVTEHYDARKDPSITSYSVNVLELKDSTEYINNGYSVLEVIGLGDSVYVSSGDIETTQRVYSVSYNPKQRTNSSMELVQVLELLTDDVTSLRNNTIAKDKNYYGISIGSTDGFVCERTDKLAKSVFNADTFAMYKGNGVGSYTPSIYFDAVSQIYKFVGDIDATGTITAGAFVGGNITGATITGSLFQSSLFSGFDGIGGAYNQRLKIDDDETIWTRDYTGTHADGIYSISTPRGGSFDGNFVIASTEDIELECDNLYYNGSEVATVGTVYAVFG